MDLTVIGFIYCARNKESSPSGRTVDDLDVEGFYEDYRDEFKDISKSYSTHRLRDVTDTIVFLQTLPYDKTRETEPH